MKNLINIVALVFIMVLSLTSHAGVRQEYNRAKLKSAETKLLNRAEAALAREKIVLGTLVDVEVLGDQLCDGMRSQCYSSVYLMDSQTVCHVLISPDPEFDRVDCYPVSNK